MPARESFRLLYKILAEKFRWVVANSDYLRSAVLTV
ncbi:protein of unknown function [Caballeronia sp. S22]